MSEKETIVTGYKAYDELEYSDDFMFGKVMLDGELCRDVLECLLQQPVGVLQEVKNEKQYRYTKDGKPIRLDIFTKDDHRYYDAEMQNLGNKSLEYHQLPKRSRFYQSSIDTDFMNARGQYRDLPDSVVMFICTFDPFRKGLSKYTFANRCEEDPGLYLDDGTTKIFCNCCYEGEDVPQDVRDLYDYIRTGKSSNELTRRIDGAVKKARKIEEWRSDYMKEVVLLMDAKNEGREEGREEERINTERERTERIRIQEELARYKSKYGELK